MSKAKSKTKLKRKPRRRAARGRGKELVEFKKREPKSVQKTVRVRVPILRALEEDAAAVTPEPISVPAAINQILEDWHAKRLAAKGQSA
jgi:hypothetical protein